MHVELLQANVALIQGLVDLGEYYLPSSDPNLAMKLVKLRRFPIFEVNNQLTELGKYAYTSEPAQFIEVGVTLAGVEIGSVDGCINLLNGPSTGYSPAIGQLVAQAVLKYPNRICVHLDFDGSFHLSQCLGPALNSVRVYRVRTWQELIASIDGIANDISDGLLQPPPSLIILDPVSAGTHFFKNSPNLATRVINHVVSSAARINEQAGSLILFCNETTSQDSFSKSVKSMFRSTLTQYRHKSIHL